MPNFKKNGINVPLAKEEVFDEHLDVGEQSHPLIWILRLTGLYFGEKKNGAFWYYFGLLRALTICTLSIYQTGYILYFLCIREHDYKTPMYIFVLSWLIQANLSIIFLIYWQLKGHLSTLLSLVKWPKKNSAYRETRRSIRNVLILLVLMLFVSFLNFALLFYWMVTKNYHKLLLDIALFKNVYTESLEFLPPIVTMFNALAWIIILKFYIIICYILHGDFVVFNQQLMTIGSKENSENLGDQLLLKYATHIKMAKMVRVVDHTFEVYAFAMLGMNIPTTIFSLLSCFSARTTHNLISLSPGPIWCILQLFGLTSIPARVHTAIQEVRNILYNNMKIWTPYNEKTYQIASIFVSHVEQGNLGISVWGFAVVTKPLILTTLSLTITYLTLLLQLRINQKDDLQTCHCHNQTNF